jgi:hypothetical protein
MKRQRVLVAILVIATGLALGVGTAHATDISGTISATVTIFEDSQLIGDITVLHSVAGAFGT